MQREAVQPQESGDDECRLDEETGGMSRREEAKRREQALPKEASPGKLMFQGFALLLIPSPVPFLYDPCIADTIILLLILMQAESLSITFFFFSLLLSMSAQVRFTVSYRVG